MNIQGGITIDLLKTEDILGTIGLKNKNTFLVGFAAESEDLEKNAKKKLVEKRLDMIVGFRMLLMSSSRECRPLMPCSVPFKVELA